MSHLRRASRRQFLTASGGLTAAVMLGGYPFGRAAAQSGEMTLLIRDDIKSAYAAQPAVDKWNESFPTKLKLDVPPAAQDVSQKIQAAQAADELIWDGFAVIEVPWDTAEWVSRGLIQPLDDYIAASTVPRAAEVVPNIIESIRESLKVDGKQYAIPGNVGSVALAWMTEPLQTAGVTTPLLSWDEVYQAAVKIKEAAPEFVPFDSALTPLCDLWAMIWGGSDKPITDEGLVDITGEVSIEALNWLRKMVDEELMPETRTGPGSATNEAFSNWQSGTTAIITSYDVAGTINQATFGKEAAATGLNMRRQKDVVAGGTPFWTNGLVVLNEAKNPQAMTDFLLWWFGPDNPDTGKQIAEIAAKPCYQYTYDQFVKDNADLQWELESIEIVRTSVPFPATTTVDIQMNKTFPWVERVLGGDRMDPKEAMESALQEIRDEIAKQR
jgi:ABC-type glycerol-3-phosphate transport system substrate-binding protein